MKDQKTLYLALGAVILIVGGFLLFKSLNKGMMPQSSPDKMQEQMQEEMSQEMEEKEQAMEKNMEEEMMGEEEMADSIESVMAKAGDKELVVDKAYLSSKGYIVVHEAKDGKPGPVIGNSELVEGSVEGVSIMLKRALKEGETVFVMLHKDDGDGEYEFPGDDAPVKTADGKVVVKKVMVE